LAKILLITAHNFNPPKTVIIALSPDKNVFCKNNQLLAMRKEAMVVRPKANFWKKIRACAHTHGQGCQIFLGPNIPKWEKYTK
jgi:hypothetical protein